MLYLDYMFMNVKFEIMSLTLSARSFRKREQISISNQTTVLYLRSDWASVIETLKNWCSEIYSFIIYTFTMLYKLNFIHYPHTQVPDSR